MASESYFNVCRKIDQSNRTRQDNFISEKIWRQHSGTSESTNQSWGWTTHINTKWLWCVGFGMTKPLMTYIMTYRRRWSTMNMKETTQRLVEEESKNPKHHQPFPQYLMQHQLRWRERVQMEHSNSALIKAIAHIEKYTNQEPFTSFVPWRNQLKKNGCVRPRMYGFPCKNTIISTTHYNIHSLK